MKKKSKKLPEKSILYTHSMTYIAIAVLACTLLSMFFLFLHNNTLRQESRITIETLTKQYTQELDAQLNAFKKIADTIQVDYSYRPDQLNVNKYREVSLIEDFSKFSSYSTLIDVVFLHYRNQDSLILPDFTSNIRIFFEMTMHLSYNNELYNVINDTITESVYRLDDNNVLLLYPVFLYGRSNPDGYAVLGILIRSNEIANRMRLLGLNDENACVLVRDSAVAGSDIGYRPKNVLKPGEAIWNGNYLSVRGDDDLTVILKYTENMNKTTQYTFFTCLTVTVAIVVLCLAACFLLTVRRQYRPLLELTQQYNDLLPPDHTFNEIGQLQEVLRRAVENNKISQRQIREQVDIVDRQRRILKDQTLLMLLSGEMQRLSDEDMRRLDIKMRGTMFAVCVLHFSGSADKQRVEEIESLSKGPLQIQALQLNRSGQLAVIVNFMEESQLQETIDMIRELAPEIELRAGTVVDSMEQLQESFLDALSMKNIEPEINIGRDLYDAGAILHMLQCVEHLDAAGCNAAIYAFVSYLGKKFPSLMMQRVIIADVMRRSIIFLRSNNIYGLEEKMGLLLAVKSPQELQKRLKFCMMLAIERMREQRNCDRRAHTQQVLRYIEEHLLDWDLAMEKIAGGTGISAREAGQIVYEETGLYCRDYIIACRIERAKEILVQEKLTVAEISARVGYSSVPAFIRTFKNMTGMTPGQYREQPCQYI